MLRAWLDERKSPVSLRFRVPEERAGPPPQFYRVFSDAERWLAEGCHPHCLKHALGYSLVEANEPRGHQTGSGHKSTARLRVYTNPTDETTG